MIRSKLSYLVVLASLAGCGSKSPTTTAEAKAPDPKVEAAWSKLVAMLPGRWEVPLKSGKSLIVEYRATSRGSVLVETWAPGTRAETLSTLHRDHDRRHFPVDYAIRGLLLPIGGSRPEMPQTPQSSPKHTGFG